MFAWDTSQMFTHAFFEIYIFFTCSIKLTALFWYLSEYEISTVHANLHLFQKYNYSVKKSFSTNLRFKKQINYGYTVPSHGKFISQIK